MAPRAPRDADKGRDRDSSPDPITASIPPSSSAKPRAISIKPAPASSSPAKPARRRKSFSAQMMELSSSPHKSMVLNTGRPGPGVSPWRIKVTVEAEPELSDQSPASPTVTHVERKTTAAVPIKESASSPVKRGRGRPRRSETPTRPAETSPTKKRGRPRKNVQPEALPEIDEEREFGDDPFVDNDLPALEEIAESARDNYVPEQDSEAEPSPKKRRGRPKKVAPPKDLPQVDQEEAASEQEELGNERYVHVNFPTSDVPTDKGAPVQSAMGNRKRIKTPPTQKTLLLRKRKPTPHAKVAAPVLNLPAEDSDDDDAHGEATVASGSDEEAEIARMKAQIDALAKGTAYGWGNAPASFDEPTTRLPDDSTIHDEDFSMISVDTLPSFHNLANTHSSMLEDGRGLVPQRISRPAEKPRLSSLQEMGSSPPSLGPRSPSNPPALQQRNVPASHAEAPRIERVASQSLRDPSRLTPAASNARRDSIDDLFKGFSEGTRKDLQAGLRRGEQLATQEEPNVSRQPTSHFSSRSEPAAFQALADDVFSRQTEDRNAPLLTPEDQTENQLPISPPSSQNSTVQYPSLRRVGPESPNVRPANSLSKLLDAPAESSAESSAESTGARPMLTAVNQQGQKIRGRDIYVEARETERGRRIIAAKEHGDEEISGSDIFVVADETEKEGEKEGEKEEISDIWQEEAINDAPFRPGRNKISRTWRRKSPGAAAREATEPIPNKLDKTKGRTVESLISREQHAGSDVSGVSDDTGLFFQKDLPRKPFAGPRKRKSDDIFGFLDDGSSSSLAAGAQVNVQTGHETAQAPPKVSRTDDSVSSARLDDGKGSLPQRVPTNTASTQAPAEKTKDWNDVPEELFKRPPIRHQRRKYPTSDVAQVSQPKVTPETDQNKNAEKGPVPSRVPPASTPVKEKSNPFRNPPPRFASLHPSPTKGSPLRREILASSSEIHSSSIAESSLPVSSPFHTQVENSVDASDEQQFRVEMETATDSSIRNLRQEADAHADAYGSQHRSLNEIEEVTERSRTGLSTIVMPNPASNNPRHSFLLDDGKAFVPERSSRTIEESTLRSRRTYSPLFGEDKAAPSKLRKSPVQEAPPAAPAGLFSRLASTLWGARAPPKPSHAPTVETETESDSLSTQSSITSNTTSMTEKARQTTLLDDGTAFVPQRPLPRARSLHGTRTAAGTRVHPILSQLHFLPLPKVEPWTRSHYVSLDRLYQYHQQKPNLFTPRPHKRSHPLNKMLDDFLYAHGLPFVGARYSCWGYSAVMTESLVVVAAVFMQLLTLESVDEYEQVNGEKIDVGECNPRKPGTLIPGREVVRRLATVVMGEDLRKDERSGREIDRRVGFGIEWPEDEWTAEEEEEMMNQ